MKLKTPAPVGDGFGRATQSAQYISGDKVGFAGVIVAKQVLGVHQAAAEIAQGR